MLIKGRIKLADARFQLLVGLGNGEGCLIQGIIEAPFAVVLCQVRCVNKAGLFGKHQVADPAGIVRNAHIRGHNQLLNIRVCGSGNDSVLFDVVLSRGLGLEVIPVQQYPPAAKFGFQGMHELHMIQIIGIRTVAIAEGGGVQGDIIAFRDVIERTDPGSDFRLLLLIQKEHIVAGMTQLQNFRLGPMGLAEHFGFEGTVGNAHARCLSCHCGRHGPAGVFHILLADPFQAHGAVPGLQIKLVLLLRNGVPGKVQGIVHPDLCSGDFLEKFVGITNHQPYIFGVLTGCHLGFCADPNDIQRQVLLQKLLADIFLVAHVVIIEGHKHDLVILDLAGMAQNKSGNRRKTPVYAGTQTPEKVGDQGEDHLQKLSFDKVLCNLSEHSHNHLSLSLFWLLT